MLEAAAYRETLLRARVNDAARANLLSFAATTDLDHLAGFYDVVRLDGETDAALRERVVLAIQGRSAAGPEERYAAVARARRRAHRRRPGLPGGRRPGARSGAAHLRQ